MDSINLKYFTKVCLSFRVKFSKKNIFVTTFLSLLLLLTVSEYWKWWLMFCSFILLKGLFDKYNRFYNPNFLFNGDDKLFKKLAAECQVYGEYGSGKSSLWVFNNLKKPILSVENNKEWSEKVFTQLNNSSTNHCVFIDCGPVKEWSYPTDDSKQKNYLTYCQSIWDQSITPDFILIDGRFRINCFLHCLKHGKEGTKILWDDYLNRTYYHIAEEWLQPVQRNSRQALFVIPKKEDLANLDFDQLIDEYKFKVE